MIELRSTVIFYRRLRPSVNIQLDGFWSKKVGTHLVTIWVFSSAVFPIANLSVITFSVTKRSEQFPLSGQTLGVMLLIYLTNYQLAQLK